MRKTVPIALAIGVAVGVTIGKPKTSTYPKAAYVVALNYESDTVTVEDATGNLWDFYGCEDCMEGDIVVMTMDDNGTPNSIYDDEILQVRFSGWEME